MAPSSPDQSRGKGAKQGSAATAGVVHELEKAEIERQLVLRNCLYGAFQSQADFTSPISYTVVREQQLLVARRPTGIG